MNKNIDWRNEFFKIINILQDNNIEISSIPVRYSKDGKRYYITLKDIKQPGGDMETIITTYNLDGNYQIGKYIKKIREEYNDSKGGILTDAERKSAEELGIVEAVNSDRQTPLFKGQKVSQFHIDIVKRNISKILTGELNTGEVIALVNEEAINANETQIKDRSTIKRIVGIILADKPEEMKKYEESLIHNIGKRTPRISRSPILIKKYHSQEQEFERQIIEEYLPQLIAGQTTFKMLEKELQTNHNTVDEIIKRYYLNSGDEKGLEEYENAKKRNIGVSPKQRKKSADMRSEIEEYVVVSNIEFLLLSKEKQEEQIMMKVRQERLKEDRKIGTGLVSKEVAEKSIERIKDYFRSKNDLKTGNINFTEQDIRNIIFAYPSVIGRDNQTLDEKFKILMSYDDINEKIAYGMVKTFPAIIGYATDRTKAQLDLLQEENLIDYAVSRPGGLMKSVSLMYALIQYAKERQKTNDLSGIARNNIFMSNSTLKRAYGTDYDELKLRFPYDKDDHETDEPYTVKGQDIGKATHNIDVVESDYANKVINQLLIEKESERKDK